MFWFKSKKRTPAVEHEVAGRDMKIAELEARLASETEAAVSLREKVDELEDAISKQQNVVVQAVAQLLTSYATTGAYMDIGYAATKHIMDAWMRDHDRLAARIEERDVSAERHGEVIENSLFHLATNSEIGYAATKRIMGAWIRDHNRMAARIQELTPPPPSALSLVAKGRLRDSSGRFLPRESK